MKEKVFVSPAKYVQGKNILKTGEKYVLDGLGRKLLVMAGKIAYQNAGEAFCKKLEDAGAKITYVPFNGQSSLAEILRIVEIGKQDSYDAVLAIGGGKVGDTARGVSAELGISLGMIPTIASTDAPTASLYAIYSEDDTVLEYRFTKNPDLVMVDTKVISQAPARYLAFGMADALATWVEARACRAKNGTTTVGGMATLAGLAIAEKCEEIIFKYGIQAYEANQAKVVTPALEYIVEANTLLSGVGYESGGLAAAHSIHNGLTVLSGEIETLSHGEKVAYGTLVQLFLENRSKEELNRFITFYKKLKLPTTLGELRIEDIPYEELLKVGEAATAEGETIHQMPFEISAEDVADALLAVDSYVRNQCD